jgi:hypothetical protein
MSSASTTWKDLLLQQQHHLTALMALNEQMVRALLGDGASRVAQARPAKIVKAAKTKGNGSAAASSRSRWFERGEAVKLAKSLLKTPMRPADLVRALGDAKGYNGALTGKESKRFESAAHQALINAVSNKSLFRSRDGMLRAKR